MWEALLITICLPMLVVSWLLVLEPWLRARRYAREEAEALNYRRDQINRGLRDEHGAACRR